MNEVQISIQTIFTEISGWFSWFLGDYDGAFLTLVVFIIIDYITAIMCVLVKKKKSNAVGFKGIFKKMLILMMVGVSNILDTFIIGIPHLLRTAIILFYISSEGTSFLENASRLGLSIPKKLRNIFNQLHNHSQKEDE